MWYRVKFGNDEVLSLGTKIEWLSSEDGSGANQCDGCFRIFDQLLTLLLNEIFSAHFFFHWSSPYNLGNKKKIFVISKEFYLELALDYRLTN